MKTITILTLALALAACARHDAPTPIATAVELAPVREESRGGATRYSATVEPDTQVAVAFRVSGYVDAINVEEGDRVAKGTVLARIRTADYEQKLGQAAASQAEARAALAQAKSDLARAEALFAANAMTRRTHALHPGSGDDAGPEVGLASATFCREIGGCVAEAKPTSGSGPAARPCMTR